MTLFVDVDLSSLPKPDVVEALDYETIRAAQIADVIARYPDYSAEALESDPVVKVLETTSYRELGVRQRVNDAARARLLAYAEKADLEWLGADAGVYRLTLDPGDPEAVPPRDPVYESDESLRRRIQLAPESLSVAGPEGGYKYHALTAGETPVSIAVASPERGTVTLTYTFDPDTVAARIKDASAIRPRRGDVLVTILGYDGDGSVDAETVAMVAAYLSSRSVRPMCADVAVQSATIRPYAPVATITVYPGLDSTAIRAAAISSLDAVAARRHRLGEKVTASVIDAALHVSGVQKVTLDGWADVVCDETEAPYMTGRTIAAEVAS
ncbi:Baseplate assembly protein J [uncultured Alphaproteobacteria bacterium]|uniref:Baseplate assembly protein J n=1 Tax=uncultured Alphaproteobacteria bacterium TaxID=91750 RepID=A0A212KMX2_9PROT|nr:Baseplate assembly protein J [uncultured Alphaproteobacteria bacterium]